MDGGGCCSYCYVNCTCYSSNFNIVNLMNCSSRSLTSLPLYWPSNMNKVFLDKNGIEQIKRNLFNNLKLTHIEEVYLQNNKISVIENGCFENMVDLKIIWLHNNSLNFINLSIFEDLPSLEGLTLHDNPWDCNCAFGPAFQRFIANKFISDPRTISCKYINSSHVYMKSARTRSVVELRHAPLATLPVLDIDFSFCANITLRTIHQKSNSVAGLTIMAAIFVFVGCVAILFYSNRLLVRVCLYNRFGVHFHHEADDDEDKPYDVFLAHARNDDVFVIGNILPELEEREVSYKVGRMHIFKEGIMIRSRQSRKYLLNLKCEVRTYIP